MILLFIIYDYSAPLITISPPIRPSALEVQAMKLLAPLLGSLTIPQDVKPRNLSRDPKVGEEYTQDPNVHCYISLRTGRLKESTFICSSRHSPKYIFQFFSLFSLSSFVLF